MKRIFLSALLVAIVSLFISSCKKDQLLTDSNAKLAFSQDSVLFDTVFTTVGSATQVFTVHNNYSQRINISSIRFLSGNSSYFRLNVNGNPGKSFSNVEIDANDSIFIFAEVTLDPNNQNTPFVISDSIVFETNGNTQYMPLQAWGQNAHVYHDPINSHAAFFLDCNDSVWKNDKPYLIYGYLIVDSGCTLRIKDSVNVHFHPRSGIIVLSGGTLIVDGLLNRPVTFQGDRLGVDFQDVPGQWNILWLSIYTRARLTIPGNLLVGPCARGFFNYAVIKNGSYGLQVDSFNTIDTTRIQNTIIKNMAADGLRAQGAHLKATNCVFANCGEYSAGCIYGGNYQFLQCTFADYWSQGNRSTPALYMQNYFDVVRPLNAYFGNCIVYGSLDNEAGLDSTTSGGPNDFNFYFDHCLLKMNSDTYHASAFHYNTILLNPDPSFKDVDNNLYQLNTTSIAINGGDTNILSRDPDLSLDLDGNARPLGSAPDLGAYENR